jgi:hypothetical protein
MGAILFRLCFILVFTAVPTTSLWGWSSEGHVFIAQEAGLRDPVIACFPDEMRNEQITLFGPFHWHNAAPGTKVDAGYIDDLQVSPEKYVKKSDPKGKPISLRVPPASGVLYWKIMDLYASLMKKKGWQYDFYLGQLAHFVADLSAPLHNFPHGGEPAGDGRVYKEMGQWNVDCHQDFDEALNTWIANLPQGKEDFFRLLTPVQVSNPDDLKREVAKIANASIELANKCYLENKRTMTQDEALKQAALSVSLLKAIQQGSMK